MRFEVVTLPDIVDGGLADFLARGHQPTTPLRHPFGLRTKGCIHDRLDLLQTVGWLATAPVGHFPQTIEAIPLKAGTPQYDSVAIHFQTSVDSAVGLPRACGQYDPAA